MSPDQAAFNEVAISRTVVADALAGRCAVLAGEIALRDNKIAELQKEVEALKKKE